MRIAPFRGRCHGDLHTDNALVRVRPHIDTEDYFLIDTALYEQVGPMTRDPMHLLLYIVARSMETITAPAQQSALIELLLDPVHGPAHLLPSWLSTLIKQVDAEIMAWVEPSGLAQRWREQAALSLAACAMLFLGRTSTRTEDKPWFLRLAARAVARFAALARIDASGQGALRTSTNPAAPSPPDDPRDPITLDDRDPVMLDDSAENSGDSPARVDPRPMTTGSVFQSGGGTNIAITGSTHDVTVNDRR